MKEISILLTKHSDIISNIIYYICGGGYTHASIGLEEEPEEFYSFGYHGFAFETIEKHRKRGVKRSRCYKIKVPEEAYKKIEKYIQQFRENKELYSYSRWGVIFCFLHIPLRRKKHYFCSEFVAELLEKSKAISLPRKSCLFKPNHFINLLEKQSGYKVIKNIV